MRDQHDEATIKRFQDAVAALTAYLHSNISADSPDAIRRCLELSNAVRWAGIGNQSVTENLGRISDDVAILCSPRKWRNMGWDWHYGHLNNAIAGLEIAASRAVFYARGQSDFP